MKNVGAKMNVGATSGGATENVGATSGGEIQIAATPKAW